MAFLFGKNPLKVLRKKARELLVAGRKVYAYRRDLWSDFDRSRCAALYASLTDSIDADTALDVLQSRYDEYEHFLKNNGGAIYPVKSWFENAEILIVAAIVAIGIRTFFIQPFKIPTNSMWPTYAGMVPYVYDCVEPKLSYLERLGRWALYGAQYYDLQAPITGDCLAPLARVEDSRKGALAFEVVRGFKWFVIPTVYRQYTLYVGDESVQFRVPYEFNFDTVVARAFFPPALELDEVDAKPEIVHTHGKMCVKLCATTRGRSFLRFEIQSGDLVLVDRFSYHFRRPQVGEPIIFRTRHIELMNDDKYYIKRLVGLSNDKISIEAPYLYRNRELLTASKIFELNYKQQNLYRGYCGLRGKPLKPVHFAVGFGMLFAMGDNSYHSFDSRYWGGVPQKDVIGRARWILYPFSERFGRAQ